MKKVLAVLLCVFMFALVFAGCGSKNESNSSNENTQTTTQQAETQKEEPKVSDPESFSGEFVWWSFFDQTPFLKEQFEKKYKNVKIKLEIFGGDEYQTKLMTTLQSGQDVPDLMDLEEGYVYKFINSDSNLFEDLGALGGEELVKDYYPWAVAMGKDSKGVLRGICDNVSPVAFWYLRDAMEKWVGTSDPDEIAEKMSDWDKIIALAREIKEKSGGTVYLWPNLAEIVKVEGYSITPFVRDGKFSIDPKWYDVIKLMRTFYDEKLVANLNSWSGEWASAWNSGSLLIRTMPSWDFFTDWQKNSGNVGVAKPPKNSYEGGTYRAIYAKSAKKELCLEFLKFLTTQEYQIENLKVNNQMPANRKVFEQIGADYKSEKFGNQNILKTYNDICNNIPEITPDQYTRAFQNSFSKHAQEGIKKGLSDEQIIDNFKKEMKDKFPEVEGL